MRHPVSKTKDEGQKKSPQTCAYGKRTPTRSETPTSTGTPTRSETPTSIAGSFDQATQASYDLDLASLREVDNAIRVSEAGAKRSLEIVAIEVPVDVSYNGNYCFSSSLSPRELEDYAYGTSLTSGMIDSADDIDSLAITLDQGRIDLDVRLNDSIDLPARIDKHATSFGLGCGLDSAEMKRRVREEYHARKSPARQEFEAIQLRPEAIWKVISSLCPHQKMHQVTGGTHAAIFANTQGEILALREDVGRHNAVDKLVGALMRRGIYGDEGFVYLSSRCAHELVLKCARYKVGIVATVSAPTSAVIDYAEREGITLCAFARDRRFTIYTHPERIVLNEADT